MKINVNQISKQLRGVLLIAKNGDKAIVFDIASKVDKRGTLVLTEI